MNLIIGLAIVTCLLAGEWELSRSGNPYGTIWLTIAISASVPLVAWFQVWFLTRAGFDRYSPDEGQVALDVATSTSTRLHRALTCHTAIWLAAMITIFGLAGWPSVALDTFGFRRFGLLGSLAMLLPAVASLLCSWAVFYPLESNSHQQSLSAGEIHWSAKYGSEVAKLIQWIALKFRIQVLLVLLPFLAVLGLNDAAMICKSIHPSIPAMAFATCLGLGVLLYPIVVRWILGLKPLSLDLSPAQSSSGEVSLWRWDTNRKVVNACAVGNFWIRQVFLSDRVLDEFPRHELLAVIRHELAHLRLNHGRWRMLFAMLPVGAGLLAASTISGCFGMEIEFVSEADSSFLWISGLMIALYLWLTLGWLSREMEFEADLVGCCRTEGDVEIQCRDQTDAMVDALLRLAAYNPGQWKSSGWQYPALSSRIEFILSNCEPIDRMIRRLWRRRLRVWMITFGSTTLVLLVWLGWAVFQTGHVCLALSNAI